MFAVGVVVGEWVEGLVVGSVRVGWCYVCVSCERLVYLCRWEV